MMNRLLIIFTLSLFTLIALYSQENTDMMIPYKEIPAYPQDFNEHTVLARVIDGLGYRYYWATEGLREEDLAFIPQGVLAKSSLETISHIYELSRTIDLAIKNLPISRDEELPQDFELLRTKTLNNLKAASDRLKSEDQPLAEKMIQFRRGDRSSDYPIWNLMNGHIADALYHTGQLVVFRRSSDNPIDAKVNVFIGKNREE